MSDSPGKVAFCNWDYFRESGARERRCWRIASPFLGRVALEAPLCQGSLRYRGGGPRAQATILETGRFRRLVFIASPKGTWEALPVMFIVCASKIFGNSLSVSIEKTSGHDRLVRGTLSTC